MRREHRETRPPHTLDEWRAALGDSLRKRGREWVGPCRYAAGMTAFTVAPVARGRPCWRDAATDARLRARRLDHAGQGRRSSHGYPARFEYWTGEGHPARPASSGRGGSRPSSGSGSRQSRRALQPWDSRLRSLESLRRDSTPHRAWRTRLRLDTEVPDQSVDVFNGPMDSLSKRGM